MLDVTFLLYEDHPTFRFCSVVDGVSASGSCRLVVESVWVISFSAGCIRLWLKGVETWRVKRVNDCSGVFGGRMRCSGIRYIFPVLFERPVSVARSATLVFRDCTIPQYFHIFILWRIVHQKMPHNLAWYLRGLNRMKAVPWRTLASCTLKSEFFL
jgi:hypothetical protein